MMGDHMGSLGVVFSYLFSGNCQKTKENEKAEEKEKERNTQKNDFTNPTNNKKYF